MAAEVTVTLQLLDADVLVDIIRDYLPAIRWFMTLEGESVGIPCPVAMEIIEGCRDMREARRVNRILSQFPIYWPTADDGNRALQAFAHHHLSHNLSAVDALIAECAIGLGATLATFNVKHFRAIPNLTTNQPYQR